MTKGIVAVRRARSAHWYEPQVQRQIVPLRIVLLDQVELPVAVPVLQLLLAGDRAGHVLEHLEPDETVDGMALRETWNGAGSVLVQALERVTRHTDVERAATAARQNVDARAAFHAARG